MYRSNVEPHLFEPGDWGYWEGTLFARCPNGLMANLANHTVSGPPEFITITPSIKCWNRDKVYHGYLTNGKWEECPNG